MNYGCWNIQGIRTKETEAFKELETHDIDMAVLSETKKKNSGNEIKRNYGYFYSGVQEDKRTKTNRSIDSS